MKCRPDPSASLLQYCWVLAADTGKLKPEDLYDSTLHGLNIGLLRVGAWAARSCSEEHLMQSGTVCSENWDLFSLPLKPRF